MLRRLDGCETVIFLFHCARRNYMTVVFYLFIFNDARLDVVGRKYFMVTVGEIRTSFFPSSFDSSPSVRCVRALGLSIFK